MSDDDAESGGPFESEDIGLAVEDEAGETTVLDSVEMEMADPESPHTALPMTETEFSGSFEVEDSVELFETLLAGKAFESGMSKELADELDEILSEDEEVAVPPPEKFLDDGEPEVVEQLSVNCEQAEQLLKVVYQKMNEYQTETGQLPERLVLGLPQFKAIEAYTQESKNQSVRSSLPVDEIIVVPGPQIHCVRDPYRMVEQSIENEEVDNGESE